MLISQIMNIGKVIETKNEYQTIVDSQKKYHRQYFVNVILDPKHDFEKVGKIQLEEYNEEKIYDYGFGITPGSGALFSPSFNIKWDDIKDQELFEKNIDNHKKVLNFEKLFQMIKKIDQEFEDKYLTQFITFLNDSEKPIKLRKEIVKELFQEFVKKEISNKDRPMRIIFSIKIKENNTERILFPGQLDGFKQLYVNLYDASCGLSSESKGLCHTCNEIKKLLGPFNTGLFTLDQYGFSIGFTGKKSNQYQVCKDCYKLCKLAFNFVEENLNFYAYKFKKGRDDIRVYHYLIPIATNLEILKESINQIRRVKYKLNMDRKMLIESKIKIKSEGMRRADRELKKTLKNELTKLKREKKRYEDDTNISFDISELIEQLNSINLSFLDIYYIVTDNKQNPTVKEIINTVLIEKERIQDLARSIEEVKTEYDLDILKFNDLNFLVEDKQFINILARFLSGGIINDRIFEKCASKTIKQAFKNKYFKKDNSSYFSNKIKTFQVMYSLFQESGNFKFGG